MPLHVYFVLFSALFPVGIGRPGAAGALPKAAEIRRKSAFRAYFASSVRLLK